MRFYAPETGEIQISNLNLESFELKSLRHKVVYVDQNVFLFCDKIKNNLTLSLDDISDDEIKEVCNMSNADPFIEKLPLDIRTFLMKTVVTH